MKHLLNTLYVTTEDIYLSLDGENVVANRDKQIIARYPLHTLQNIITFTYPGASPALMGACVKRDIGMAFCTPKGKFLCRIDGENNGNVTLRREQYRIADDTERSLKIAENMIFAKLYNGKWVIERICRDHSVRVDVEKLHKVSYAIGTAAKEALQSTDHDYLRGIEGAAATEYFGVFDDMILNDKDIFKFNTRNRRPPLDPVNAMLSFAYSLLANECASALESVGLDAYVGFLHTDRPGRVSLALDMMEELRSCMADRFVLSMINNRRVCESDFLVQDSGAVLLNDNGRKAFLRAWQEKKRESIKHPYLKERMEWGMVPYVQALLLARHIRGDLDEYLPFLWK